MGIAPGNVAWYSYGMDLSTALAQAMKAANLRDEEVSVASKVSAWTIAQIRLGRARSPRPITVEALKRSVPGLTDLLNQDSAAA